jgi:nucleoside-diphosphate-sugar epimerase
MPQSQTVLVTGATGFIAKHCIKKLLAEGYSVRASLRSPGRADEVRNAVDPDGAAKERLSFVTLDLNRDEGWDEAMQGCSYVQHVASPFPPSEPDHEDDLIIPAREGALRALRAAAKAGVKRVVLTSSSAAIAYGRSDEEEKAEQNKVFCEADWSNTDGPISAYAKSKTLAERAAWDFINSDEAKGMELAVINPVAVLGPLLDKQFSTSGQIISRLIDGKVPACPRLNWNVIDVRDVASAHYEAMVRPEAAGQRFILESDSAWMLDISKILAKAGYKTSTRGLPDFALKLMAMFDKTLRMTVNGLGKSIQMDNTALHEVLGITPYSVEEMTLSMAKTMREFNAV